MVWLVNIQFNQKLTIEFHVVDDNNNNPFLNRGGMYRYVWGLDDRLLIMYYVVVNSTHVVHVHVHVPTPMLVW